MKVTSEILSSSQLLKTANLLSSKLVKNDDENFEDNQNITESDVVSITRENLKAVDFSLSSFFEAIEKMNSVKNWIGERPEEALIAQGNILPEAANFLI